VTPILSGQQGNEKNPIPPFHPNSAAQKSTGAGATTSKPKAEQPSAEMGDLIDFGQNDEPQTQTTAPTDVEQILRSTSTSNPGDDQGPLIDFHEGMKSDLPKVGQNLKRQDTETQSIDEFVDAQG
jgi:oxysterol-binding protein-related protein 8